MTFEKKIELIARIGIFGTFIGHGILAFNINPNWISLLNSIGMTKNQAVTIMPYIGILDIIVAFVILFYPNKTVIAWAFFWTLITAMMRPISGESILEFIERSANWTLPIVLLIVLNETSKRVKKIEEK